MKRIQVFEIIQLGQNGVPSKLLAKASFAHTPPEQDNLEAAFYALYGVICGLGAQTSELTEYTVRVTIFVELTEDSVGIYEATLVFSICSENAIKVAMEQNGICFRGLNLWEARNVKRI